MAAKAIVLAAIFMGLGIITPAPAAAVVKPEVKLWLSVERGANNMVTLQPMCRSHERQQVDYTLLVIKQGANGSSTNKQGGKAVLIPDHNTPLCRISLNLSDNDDCWAKIVVRDKKGILAEKTIKLTGEGAEI